jgi:hypothetical protein
VKKKLMKKGKDKKEKQRNERSPSQAEGMMRLNQINQRRENLFSHQK